MFSRITSVIFCFSVSKNGEVLSLSTSVAFGFSTDLLSSSRLFASNGSAPMPADCLLSTGGFALERTVSLPTVTSGISIFSDSASDTTEYKKLLTSSLFEKRSSILVGCTFMSISFESIYICSAVKGYLCCMRKGA